MASLNLSVTGSMSVNIGAEVKGFDFDPARVVQVDDLAHDVTAKVTGGGAAVTLWDASTSVLPTFRCGFIIVDPESNSQTQTPAQEVVIRFTRQAGTTYTQKRDRLLDWKLGKSAGDAVGDTITKIEAVPATGSVAVTNDVNVRLCVFGTAV